MLTNMRLVNLTAQALRMINRLLNVESLTVLTRNQFSQQLITFVHLIEHLTDRWPTSQYLM